MIDRRACLTRLGGALTLAALPGCGGAPRPAPRLGGDPPHRAWAPPAEPRATVVLVPGLGTNGLVFDLPGAGGLAPALVRLGYRVVAAELPADADLAAATAALDRLAARSAGPTIGLGLDLGGTALYGATGYDALITLGAPIASGGFSPAMRRVLTAAGAPTWRTFARDTLRGTPLTRIVLTDGLPDHVHRPLRRSAFAPMPSALRDAWYRPGADRPVPHPLPVLDALRRPRPTLCVLSPADALAPPWQCDPAAFGVRHDALTRLYPTRANGFEREYPHLDLAIHPDARREIWPQIFAWLDENAARGESEQRMSEG